MNKNEIGDKMKNENSGSITVVEAGKTEKKYWKDLWSYRELFLFLAWRDVSVRYKQTAIGVLWAVLRPFLTMIIFTIVFGKLAKFPSEGIPYPILVYSGMLPWYFFSTSLSESSNSLIVNNNLISKIYFPRLIIPTSSVIVSFIDFALSFAILGILMIWYKFIPSINIVFLPLFIAMAFGFAIGAGLWFCSLNVKFRDFRYIVPFVVQFGLYISPVGFNSSIVPEKFRFLYSINPMVGVIDGFRWAIIGQSIDINFWGFVISLGVIFLLLISGVIYFRKTEKKFADII